PAYPSESACFITPSSAAFRRSTTAVGPGSSAAGAAETRTSSTPTPPSHLMRSRSPSAPSINPCRLHARSVRASDEVAQRPGHERPQRLDRDARRFDRARQSEVDGDQSFLPADQSADDRQPSRGRVQPVVRGYERAADVPPGRRGGERSPEEDGELRRG